MPCIIFKKWVHKFQHFNTKSMTTFSISLINHPTYIPFCLHLKVFLPQFLSIKNSQLIWKIFLCKQIFFLAFSVLYVVVASKKRRKNECGKGMKNHHHNSHDDEVHRSLNEWRGGEAGRQKRALKRKWIFSTHIFLFSELNKLFIFTFC